MKPSVRHRQAAVDLHTFLAAYIDMMNCTKVVDDWPSKRLVANVDNATWQAKQRAVAHAAGAAGPAHQKYGGVLTLQNASYMAHGVNPVVNWDWSLRDPRGLEPRTVVTAVETAIARADHEAKAAAQRERGFTGLIAAFLRWPADLRETVGPGRAQRTAAGAVGIAGQIFVGVVVTGLAALLGAALKAALDLVA